MKKSCDLCKAKIEDWNKHCAKCGFTLVLEPDKKIQERFLRCPSLGAILWTQGWSFGARLYFWFFLSLIPLFGFIILFLLFLFGRRWSWKYGGWGSWEEYQSRMRFLDLIGGIWFLGLGVVYLWIRFKL
ncbi:MAG: hypothetical protein UU48_C0008G0021 [Candidatus Uhrbacteria bacterium GW2011_GWF2_41_16]|uniref:Uncharacterized protein n=2 Tax=Candidatus Uhriibacteriota TaxID=1752732 RepID=A0A0G0YBV4_9BACT|nr:MAG: hypothetical protein UU35_C0014G0016 [Candidatus Uhrbacteria bacterium GW2011_GWC2_41_11]KKR97812.1 MAG: hypothetical protein UU48_C0008G0021 [Candidatus Uhrbacteria bacterium GW2011_GWF2_41_16]HBP00524.1 hypothetical protein [Candidatus Uhrbacteria bacterium]